jgi:hypothetical protein
LAVGTVARKARLAVPVARAVVAVQTWVVAVVLLHPVKEMSGAGGLARLAAVGVGQVLRAVTAMAWVALATAVTELRHLLPDQVSLMAAAVEAAVTRRVGQVVQVVVARAA